MKRKFLQPFMLLALTASASARPQAKSATPIRTFIRENDQALKKKE
jgi:hypothetical protein